MSAPKLVREKVSSTSGDVVTDQVAKLKSLFPECVSEGKIDFGKLRSTLGDAAEAGPGRFTFSWAGKDDAVGLLQTPSRGTLIPCPDESINFDTTNNAFIEGDNLEVLKLLFKPYFGKVKLIFIDPPYNTGQDFVYPDNFTDPLKNYLVQTEQIDDDGNLATSKIDRAGRVHSGWLSMMYPRLFLARQLLREDGMICVSIDDNEMHHLRLLMNEVFGEENFVATCIWQKRYSRENRGIIGDVHDYLVFFTRDLAAYTPTKNLLPLDNESRANYRNPNNDPRGPWQSISHSAQGYRPNQMYDIKAPNGTVHKPPQGRCWATVESEYKKLEADGRAWFGADGNGVPRIIRYLSEVEGLVPWTWWPHEEVGHTDEAKKEVHEFFGKEESFDTPKPTRLMKRVLQVGTKNDQHELVLDFFAGSGTMAQAVLELNHEEGGNRSFIMVQLPYLRHPGYGLFFDSTRNHDPWIQPAQLSEQEFASVGAFLKLLEARIPVTPLGDAAAESSDVDPGEVGDFQNQIKQKNFEVADTNATVKTRGSAQKAFAEVVKANYGNRCAITGILTKAFLVAAHIVPWSKDQSIRLDPSNGICLSLLVDRAFENGYLLIEDDRTIRIDWGRVGDDTDLRRQLKPYDGRKLKPPTKGGPRIEYLQRRRALVILSE